MKIENLVTVASINKDEICFSDGSRQDMNYNVYSVKYCSVVVPKELQDAVPIELKTVAADEYARLKDGIEVADDSLQELITTLDWNNIDKKWRDFIIEVSEIKADTYIFHN